MNNVRIHVYCPGSIPEAVARAIRTMGARPHTYHLRRVARGDKAYPLIECIVLFLDDKPIGWTALYYEQKHPHRKHVGVWVRTRYRRRGYGRALCDLGFNNWSLMYPITYGYINELWNAKYRGEDASHKAWQNRAN